MKKNSKKIKTENVDAMKHLNDELGFFGLEPPKVYREEQKQPLNRKKDAKMPAGNKKRTKSAPAQSREQNVRHVKKKRRLKKKFRVAFTAIGLVFLIAIIVLVLCLTVFFKIETITVTGTKKYTSQQITSVLPIEKGKNLFAIDKKGAASKVEENLPYVYNLEITRKLPSTVIVNVTEPSFVYYVKNSNDTYTYFDDNFKILEAVVKSAPKKGIELKKAAFETAVPGKTATITNKDLVSDIEALMKCVSDLKLKKITAIYSESLVTNYMVYDNRITIKLGETKDVQEKIFTALAAIDKLNESNPGAEGTLTATNSKQIYFTEKK